MLNRRRNLVMYVLSGAVLAGAGVLGVTYYSLRLPRPAKQLVEELVPAERGLVVAHRGESVDAPENTLVAFRLAKKNKAAGVEFDLSYTSDGHAVLLHDDDVDRTTDGTGPIDQLTLAEVRQLNAAYNHKYRDKVGTVQIPILEEAVQECLRLNLTMFIDVKGNATKSAAVLSSIFRQYNLFNKAIVCSFSPYIVYKVKQAEPRIVTAITHRKWFLSESVIGRPRFSSSIKHYLAVIADIILEWSIHHWLYDICGCSVVLMHRHMINKDYLLSWKEKGVRVVVWTVNSADEKQYFHDTLKVSYMTDCTRPGADCANQTT